MRSRPLAFALLALALAGARTASAADAESDKAQCLSAYEAGQRARKAGQLQMAKASFGFCGSNACPRVMHADCGRWLAEVEAELPTVVFRVAGGGVELDGARIAIDGGLEHELDGRAVELDPGEHSIAFTHEGYQPLERSFRFSVGDKLVQRRVELVPLPSPSPSSSPGDTATNAASSALAPEPAPSSTLVPAWLGVGVGTLGVAGLVYFGATARKDESALAVCSPSCSKARVAEVRREYLLANVSLGVGAAGFLTAAAWLLFRPQAADQEPQRISLGIGPVTTLNGRF
jgi:hypothetical protein